METTGGQSAWIDFTKDFELRLRLERGLSDNTVLAYLRDVHHLSRWAEPLLVVVVVLSLAAYPYVDAKFRNAPMYWLVLVPFILVFVQQQGSVSRWLRSKPMLFLGSLAMPVFLTHQMLIGCLQHRLPDMPAVLMLAACVLATLMVSWTVQIIFSRLLR